MRLSRNNCLYLVELKVLIQSAVLITTYFALASKASRRLFRSWFSCLSWSSSVRSCLTALSESGVFLDFLHGFFGNAADATIGGLVCQALENGDRFGGFHLSQSVSNGDLREEEAFSREVFESV